MRRIRFAEEPEGWEKDAGLLGDAKALDTLDLTDAEWRAEKKRLREKLARRIPLGFPLPEKDERPR